MGFLFDLKKNLLDNSSMGTLTKPRGKNGRKNQVQGAQFENIFIWTCRSQGFGIEQLPKLGARYIGKNKIIKTETPFDYIIYKDGATAFLDAKSFNTNVVNFSYLDKNQVNSLMNAYERGIPSGYVVWHRSINSVVFYKAPLLFSLLPRKTLKPEHGIYLGSMENFSIPKIFKDFLVL